jgi:hypothetical protein
MAARAIGGDDSPRTLREIVQKKFLDEVFGAVAGYLKKSFCLHQYYADKIIL